MRKYALGMGALLLAFMLGPPKPLRAGTIGLTLNNPGNNVMGGVYVGGYNFTVGSQQMQLVCDDFQHDVYAGESWTANTSTFSQSSFLSNVLFTGTNEKANYEEVGWLVQQMFSPANSGNAVTVGDIQWAIWDVFYPVQCSNGKIGISNCDPWGNLSAYQSGINYWLSQAQMPSNYSTGNYSNLVIYTPVPGTPGPPQEYFGMQAMPESMTLWSLLVALAAIALAYKWVDKATVEPTASGRV